MSRIDIRDYSYIRKKRMQGMKAKHIRRIFETTTKAKI